MRRLSTAALYNRVGGYKSVLGELTMNRGTATISAASNSSSSLMTVNGDLTINHVASAIAQNGSGYTPLTLNAGTTTSGAQLVLKGSVIFRGNATNSQTVTIAAAAGTNLGSVQLAGVRTFDIGNGAAAHDLMITAGITNNGVTAGGLTKTRLGTLALAAVNTYSEATTVEAGTLTLIGSGALDAASALTVKAGATFDTAAQSCYSFGTSTTTTLGIGATAAGQIRAQALTFTGASLALDFGATESLLASYQLLDYTGTDGREDIKRDAVTIT